MSKQKIQLSDHFNYSRLLRFVLPCIGTMLFTSIYGIVDGLCVSNFVGKTAFAAVNLIMPLPRLQLFIVDEGHGASFTTQEGQRYSVRRLGVGRGLLVLDVPPLAVASHAMSPNRCGMCRL